MSCVPDISLPGLPDIPIPSLPSLAFDIDIPLPSFDFPLPSISLPGLPDIPIPSLPSLAFELPVFPPLLCPTDGLAANDNGETQQQAA